MLFLLFVTQPLTVLELQLFNYIYKCDDISNSMLSESISRTDIARFSKLQSRIIRSYHRIVLSSIPDLLELNMNNVFLHSQLLGVGDQSRTELQLRGLDKLLVSLGRDDCLLSDINQVLEDSILLLLGLIKDAIKAYDVDINFLQNPSLPRYNEVERQQCAILSDIYLVLSCYYLELSRNKGIFQSRVLCRAEQKRREVGTHKLLSVSNEQLQPFSVGISTHEDERIEFIAPLFHLSSLRHGIPSGCIEGDEIPPFWLFLEVWFDQQRGYKGRDGGVASFSLYMCHRNLP